MTVDAELLEILVCPNDRGEIDYLEDQQVIVCRTCGYRYPVRDDIPVMLIDEAEKPEAKKPGASGDAISTTLRPSAWRTRRGCSMPSWAMPSDCRSAYDSARQVDQLPSPEGVTSVTFCGMGGSAVAGDVVRSVFRERLGLPVEVNRSPVLPEHCGSHTLVVCSSFSGDTAETLSAVRTALGRGCRVLVVTSGGTIADEAAEHGIATVRVPPGFQPRAALGHLGVRDARRARDAGAPAAARDGRDRGGRRDPEPR